MRRSRNHDRNLGLTRIEWFSKLPSEIFLQAVEATKKQSYTPAGADRKLHEMCSSLSVAIDGGFTWANTPQGHAYWSRIDSDSHRYEINDMNVDLYKPTLKAPQPKKTIYERKNDWKFGMEPTFMISPELIPKSYYDLTNEKGHALYTSFVTQMSRMIGNALDNKKGVNHSWWKNGEFDNEGCVEFPTPTYTNFKAFMKDYKSLVKELKKYEFVPSSLTCLIIEGGCHQNFDLEWVKKTYGNVVLQKLLRNLITFLNENPWVVWTFLSPEDNVSSKLKRTFQLDKFSKGDFLTTRENSYILYEGDIRDNEDFSVEYLELRFFMQPRDFEEMTLHYDFALQLMNWALKVSVEDPKYPTKIKEMNLKSLTFKESLKGMKKACKEIDFPFSRIEEAGKMELLKMRFENGKNWLV